MPEASAQNGMAERAERTIVETARCLLLQANLPKTFRLTANAIACCLQNLVSTNNESNCPFEKFTGEKRQSEKLRKFGCTVLLQNAKVPGKNFMKSH